MSDHADEPGAAVWNGRALLGALTAAADWLNANRDQVDALNVFPVPDGDTGTNMALTLGAALNEVRTLPIHQQQAAGHVALKAAHGALMGARGNSGVILSQVFRGLSRGIAGLEAFDGRDLARALGGARDMAYSAVMRPVEGTMLTVIRVAAERAAAIAGRAPFLQAVLQEALQGAREALASTPDLLEILRQAGVVDAGGQGLVHILEGMDLFARGEPVPAAAVESIGALGERMAFLDRIDDLHGTDVFGYCTNFMIFGQGIDFSRVREEMSAMGESAVIVGDETVVKVHIHSLNPGKVLDYAIGHGDLGQIKIDNMNAQTNALIDQRPGVSPGVARDALSDLDKDHVGKQAILAVAAGEGLAAALRSMGATGIISGGQSMNPSVEELLSAVEASSFEEVLLLPNNSNVVLAANHVPELTSKQVLVVPTQSVPQGIAAIGAFNTDADLRTNATAMTKAMSSIRTIEITRAEKQAAIDGTVVAKGQMIGLLDDRLVASGEDFCTVAMTTLDQADLNAAELITIFTGEDLPLADASALQQALEQRYPSLAVELYEGHQPHYHLVISVE